MLRKVALRVSIIGREATKRSEASYKTAIKQKGKPGAKKSNTAANIN
jgi:hypothetical protein